MATDINLIDITVLRTDRLEKTGEQYALVSLSAQNIDQILALKDIAFDNLGAGEKTYLADNKDRDFFESHFAVGNEVLGIVHDGHLIAQAIIVNPTPANPETGLAIEVDAPIDSIAVLQGAIVHPDYRGNHLQGVLVDERIAMAERNGRTEIFSEVALNNSFSWFVLMKKGLHIESTGISPHTGAEVYVMRGKPPALHLTFNGSAEDKRQCPQLDIAQQKDLLAAGYKGTGFDPAGKTLTFQRPAGNAFSR